MAVDDEDDICNLTASTLEDVRDNDVSSVQPSIHGLPIEILELILRLVSPYEDLRNCRLVCKEWHKLVQDVAKRKRSCFVRDVRLMNVRWSRQSSPDGPSIVPRYGHACCRHADSMFVFGGCTGRNTTFNDLWRFDLNSRRWVRPLAVGTYPPPMAFSTFVTYKDTLVLFGGLTYPSPSFLHHFHNYRLYNHLHFYETQANQWSELNTATSPPHVAGHSATVHGFLMVVFGGRQFLNGRYNGKCNDVWVLNLKTIAWWKQTTSDPKPPPMVNQTQVAIDDDNILIIDRYGGPNMDSLSDVWLLKIEHEPDIPWTWTKISVRNQQHAASNPWCHPACKVEDKLIFLGQGPRSMSPISTSLVMSQEIRIPPRVWIPPREEDVPLLRVVGGDHHMQNGNNLEDKRRNEIEMCVNGKRGVLPVRKLSAPSSPASIQSCSASPSFSTSPSSSLSSSSSSSSSLKLPSTKASDTEASCSLSRCTNESKKESDKAPDELESSAERPVICSQCGSPKLHSSKRRRISNETFTGDDSVDDDPHQTEFCLCLSTASESGNDENCVDSNSIQVSVSNDSPDSSTELSSSSPSIVRNSAMPSVRPNALKNRARQMDSFQRMEQRIRNMMRPSQPQPIIVGEPQPNAVDGYQSRSPIKQHLAMSARQPMIIYVLDISAVVERGVVEWLPLHDQSTSDGPEDTLFYSLVNGRGEIVMFGGIQKDHNCLNRGEFCTRSMVSNQVYILSSKPQTF